MKLVHEDGAFQSLIRAVASSTGIAPPLIEKDYWVTHVLWAIHRIGLEIWFKGGTSLSKGFKLIQRFSEDLDLRIEPGSVEELPKVGSWTSMNKGPVTQRREYFEALGHVLAIPNAKVVVDTTSIDGRARNAEIRAEYPGGFLEQLAPSMRPFVLLEVGAARVTPFVERPLTSFVHDWLSNAGQMGAFGENRPLSVRCVHPTVTLLEKLDAVSRRFARAPMTPANFIRHYEDAAAIIAHEGRLPSLQGLTVRQLAEEMVSKKQIVAMPDPDDPAFRLSSSRERDALERAHAALAPMYWGPRRSLQRSCELVRGWILRLGA
jgi:hypothetical protein